ncbi:MAG: M24 family metallopeptidase [Nitrososphaerales archaeon]
MVETTLRVKKIFERIDNDQSVKLKPDALVLANGVEPHLDASFFYLTGFPYGLFEGSYLYARRDGGISVLTSPLEETIARSHSNGIDVYALSIPDDMSRKLKELSGRGAKVIGINSSELTFKSYTTIKSIFRGAKLVDVNEAIQEARLIKDGAEIKLMQKACDIASNIYAKIPSMLSAGVTESEIAAGMAYEMQRAGGSGVAFDSIVAFGKNSAEPHYLAGQAKLRNGQFVLTDYGTKYMRYCSDITRTLVFGSASTKQKKMYKVVRDALEFGKELCTTENTGEEVNSKVTRFIDSTEFKGRFIHSTGHSLGLAVHDGPGLSRSYKKKLEPGMVLTVEPGIYIPGVGGVRIEDDVLITKGKAKVLTNPTRDFIEV